MKKIDHEYTLEIVCPYCGYEFQDSWERRADFDNLECHECDKIFAYERIVTCEYTTTKYEKGGK